MIRFRDRILLAYRQGDVRSTIRLAGLSEDYRVLWDRPLVLPQVRENQLGCEDPRLFVYQDDLHVAYSGLESHAGSWTVNMLYGRLNGDDQVDRHFAVSYQHRQRWEKNWQFFQYQQELFCVYGIAPHVILKIAEDEASFCYRENWPVIWKRGLLRGGAPPVLVGDEYYCFFHGMDRSTDPPTYTLGCYTFESEPPFRPLRSVQEPLLRPTRSDQPAHIVPHCVYPCGATIDENHWTVSYGYYDHEIWLVQYAFDELEEALLPIPYSHPSN